MTPSQIYDNYVGSQSVSEFLRYAKKQGYVTVDAAVEHYVFVDFPLDEDVTDAEKIQIYHGILAYIDEYIQKNYFE